MLDLSIDAAVVGDDDYNGGDSGDDDGDDGDDDNDDMMMMLVMIMMLMMMMLYHASQGEHSPIAVECAPTPQGTKEHPRTPSPVPSLGSTSGQVWACLGDAAGPTTGCTSTMSTSRGRCGRSIDESSSSSSSEAIDPL